MAVPGRRWRKFIYSCCSSRFREPAGFGRQRRRFTEPAGAVEGEKFFGHDGFLLVGWHFDCAPVRRNVRSVSDRALTSRFIEQPPAFQSGVQRGRREALPIGQGYTRFVQGAVHFAMHPDLAVKDSRKRFAEFH